MAWSDGRGGSGNDIYAQRVGGDGTVTGVRGGTPRPAVSALSNSPNPFRWRTTIEFYVESMADVTLEVFDVTGRVVFERKWEQMEGWRSVEFQARDTYGKYLPSGVYLYRLSIPGGTQTRKMVIAR